MDYVQAEIKFVQWMKVKGLAKNTIKNYAFQIRMLGITFKETDRFRNITSEQIMEYLLTKIAVNSQRHAHSAIKLFYRNIIGQPFKFNRIPYAKKEKKLPEPLEEYEIQAILDVCTNVKHKSIICLAYACGLRVSEIINLKISDIDGKSGIINIRLAKGKKDRIVPLPDKLLFQLREYYKQYRPVEYLFNGQGTLLQYSESSINQFLKDLAKKAKIIKNVHIHLLRHSYASHSLEQGVDIRYIQEILGHSSPKTTQIYTHCSKKAISRISSPINSIQL